MNRFITLFFLTLLCFPQNSVAQSFDDVAKLLNQYLTIQEKRIGFNGVVLIAKNDTVLYKKVIGKASFELNIPLTMNSKFKIASISKSFTAMLITLAVNEEKLNLNDSLALFFPELKDSLWRRITIDQLLSHRSGIPHNEGIIDYWSFKSRLPLNNQQSLAEIFKTKLLFKPGTSAKYSSPGYFLLATIVEKVYHQNYAAILKEKITGPLHMNNTGIYNTKDTISGITSSYHLLGDSLIVAPYRDFSLMKGSGDLYSNSIDLLKWTSSFSGSRWNDRIKSQIFTVHSDKSLQNNGDMYGFGWFIRPLTNELKTAYYHGGGTYGCSSICVWYPEERISIVILSNISVLPMNELWSDIENILFKRPFKLPEIKRSLSVSPEQLKKFEGSYATASGDMKLVIIADKEHLYAKLGNNPAFEIYSDSPLEFYGKKVNVKFAFQSDQVGLITGLRADGRGQILTFNKK